MATGTDVKILKAHLALNVRDVERSIDFYRRMLGIEPSKVRAGYAKFDVVNPPLNLTLNQGHVNEQGALSHLGLQVASTGDVLAVRERWAEAGLVTRDEMDTDCCYARQDKTWAHDPDGYEWEVFAVLEDDLAETSMCCVTDAPVRLTAAGAAPKEAASCATSPAESTAEAASCGCTAAPPAAGQSPCCDTQAAAFQISR